MASYFYGFLFACCKKLADVALFYGRIQCNIYKISGLGILSSRDLTK